MTVSKADLTAALRGSSLSGRAVCVHCSLRSFGDVEGGASTLIDAFIDEGSTLLVPSFSWVYSVPPPANDRPLQNGTRYDMPDRPLSELIFDLTSTEVDRDMGALSAAVVSHPERRRGNHPVCSFSALGPLADELVRCQQPRSVWAPLERLVWLDGAVALLGVDLTRLSLIHLAEQHAGRRPFVRWARGGKGEVVRVDVGGCSDGFGSFEPVLADVALTEQVGESRWMVVHAGQALRLLTRAIEESPGITRCLDPACERCGDAVAGGPIL